jgi:hypothetical protein
MGRETEEADHAWLLTADRKVAAALAFIRISLDSWTVC